MNSGSPKTVDSLSTDQSFTTSSMQAETINTSFLSGSSLDLNNAPILNLDMDGLAGLRPESGLSDITIDDNYNSNNNFQMNNKNMFDMRRKMLGERDRVSDSVLDYGSTLNSIDMDGLGLGLGQSYNNNNIINNNNNRFGRNAMDTNNLTDIESVGSGSNASHASFLSDMQCRFEKNTAHNQKSLQQASPSLSAMRGLLGDNSGNMRPRRSHSGSFDSSSFGNQHQHQFQQYQPQQQQHQQHHQQHQHQNFNMQHQNQNHQQQHMNYQGNNYNNIRPQQRSNQNQLDLTSIDDDMLRELVCNIALRVLQEAANNSRNIHKSARNVADILNTYEIPQTGAVLKAVELANALRTKIGTPVLAHIRGRFGGLLNLLEQSEKFCVIRIPRNDFVTLTSTAKVLNDFAQQRSTMCNNGMNTQSQHHQQQQVNYNHSHNRNTTVSSSSGHMDAPPPGFYNQQQAHPHTTQSHQHVFDLFGEGRIDDIKLVDNTGSNI